MLQFLKKFIFQLLCPHDRWVISRSRPGYQTCKRCRKRKSMRDFFQRLMSGSGVHGHYADDARDMDRVRRDNEIARAESRTK